MNKFELYLEAVRKSINEASGKGTNDIMNIIKSGKANVKTNGVLHSSEDLTQGAIVAFDPEMYPNADVDELKDEYENYIKDVMKKDLGPNPTKKNLMEIDDISLDFWSDEEVYSKEPKELPDGYEGFAWGVPDY